MLSNSPIVHQTIIHLILPMKVIEFHLLGVPNGLQAEKVCCACLLSCASFSPSPLGAKKGSFESISSLTPPTLSPRSCPRVLQPDSGLPVEQTCLQAPGPWQFSEKSITFTEKFLKSFPKQVILLRVNGGYPHFVLKMKMA